MAQSMKESGATAKPSDMENSITSMATSMKGSGAIIKLMALELTSMPKEPGTKASGRTTNSTGMVSKSGMRALSMRDSTS